MGPYAVVAPSPGFDDGLGLFECLEDLSVQKFDMSVTLKLS